MNVIFDYEEVMFNIKEEIGRIPTEVKKQSKTIMNKTAKIIKANVIAELAKHRTDSNRKSNYDGTTPYIHMANDIKTSVKDNDGEVVAIVRGGKYTGYKWHLVNNGTVDSKATHFIDNALKASENEFNDLIDKMVTKVVQDGG